MSRFLRTFYISTHLVPTAGALPALAKSLAKPKDTMSNRQKCNSPGFIAIPPCSLLRARTQK